VSQGIAPNAQLRAVPQGRGGRSGLSRPNRVWIDLDNSPHVPFFIPIIEELDRRGCSVSLTARNCFQVCALADMFGLSYRLVGRHYGKHKAMKAFGTCLRALQLLPHVRKERPDLAVSHGSRSQMISAKLARIPTVVICDYEFAEPVPGVAPTWVMVPEVIPDASVKFGRNRILKYPGIKEDVYVPRFKPDAGIMGELGLEDGDVIVTLRPPATEAHYRNPESDQLLDATLALLSRSADAKIVLLPRNEKQAEALRKAWPDLFSSGKMTIPKRALDGLNLMWHSDLVISGGGTMNREAAALGVPVYSIFRGSIGAVDRYLDGSGRLTLLTCVEDVRSMPIVKRRRRLYRAEMASSGALNAIVEHLVAIMEADGRGAETRK
jgi:predicted glycosyltransferase